MNEKQEIKYPRGMCWWLGLCDWWNPPLECILNGIAKTHDFCIKCWKFKKNN